MPQQHLWPLRQLADICDVAKTRYGYIVTDQELVACCFYKSETGTWEAAVMPVPWSRHGQAQLTTDLALWWLCMLAMPSPQHRALVSRANLVGIGEWELRRADHGLGWVRRHRYSGVERPGLPPWPPVFSAEPLGNRATFADAHGMHMDTPLRLGPPPVHQTLRRWEKALAMSKIVQDESGGAAGWAME